MKSKDVYLGKKMKMANARFLSERIKYSLPPKTENKNSFRAAQSSDGYDTDSSDLSYDVDGHDFNASCRTERQDEELENS
jgi:hypothetical protein